MANKNLNSESHAKKMVKEVEMLKPYYNKDKTLRRFKNTTYLNTLTKAQIVRQLLAFQEDLDAAMDLIKSFKESKENPTQNKALLKLRNTNVKLKDTCERLSCRVSKLEKKLVDFILDSK